MVFGQPAPAATWGWRVEGHHVSLNFTIVDGVLVAATPSFFGANPARVPRGPRQGLRALAAEEDLGRQLVLSLTPRQKQVAILNQQVPADIITGSARAVTPLQPTGLLAAAMSYQQNEKLLALIREYLGRNRPELAEADLKKIRSAGIDRIGFVWIGGLEQGEAHYYRVQGPTFLLEYDNIQNQANHIHAVWRDFENDFGDDLLKRHYERSAHHQ
jgi:hypothetical protein